MENNASTPSSKFHLLVISCDEEKECCTVYPEKLKAAPGDKVVIVARNTDVTVTIPHPKLTNQHAPFAIKDFREQGMGAAKIVQIKPDAPRDPEKGHPYVVVCAECVACPPSDPQMIIE